MSLMSFEPVQRVLISGLKLFSGLQPIIININHQNFKFVSDTK